MRRKAIWTVAILAGIALVTTVAVTAACNDPGGGARAASETAVPNRTHESPLPTPTPTEEYYVYLPCVLRQFSTSTPPSEPETSTPTPTATDTPTPTPTSTPTPTPTSTPTPTPTSTVTPTVVHVLPNDSYYVDSEDNLHIVGEVQNDTADHIHSVGIAVNILDGDGALVDTGHGYAYLRNLPAGEKTCFHISLPEPADWSSYEFEAPTYLTGGEPLPNLTILNDSGSYFAPFGWYLIGGEVRNDHGTRVEAVTAIGTVYDASGVVLGCKGTYVPSINLEPEETSIFELVFSGRNYADADAYRVQADGDPQ